MKKNLPILVVLFFVSFIFFSCMRDRVVSVADFGLQPNTGENATPYVIKALQACRNVKSPVLYFPEGRYDFYPDESQCDTLFISAHDHEPHRYTGIKAVGFDDLTLDGGGSDFVFHKYMVPVAFIDCNRPKIKNFSLDFEKPNATQARVLSSEADSIVVQFDSSEDVSVEGGAVYLRDDSIKLKIASMNEFVADSNMVAWNTADQSYRLAKDLGQGKVALFGLAAQPTKGNILFLRNGYRPNPGIFNWRCKDMFFSNIDIYWAQGMGILSQRCENITMDKVDIKLKEGSKRVFTTLDALHFTACRGLVKVENGLYENMLDDAINVHGDYLHIVAISADRTVITTRYGHRQSFGYEAAEEGEHIQYITAATMLVCGNGKVLKSERIDDCVQRLTLCEPLPEAVKVKDCVENTDWTPQVEYRNNTIRNNRARGALFSSPGRTIVANNLFDRCSGSAILLSSDCNDWFLSGACSDILIKNNHFNLCMTSFYQYCEAVISIYPTLRELSGGYHTNVRIEGNRFTVFEPSLLYAVSVDKLVFKNNEVVYAPVYNPILKEGTPMFNLINCTQVELSDNNIPKELQAQ